MVISLNIFAEIFIILMFSISMKFVVETQILIEERCNLEITPRLAFYT